VSAGSVDCIFVRFESTGHHAAKCCASTVRVMHHCSVWSAVNVCAVLGMQHSLKMLTLSQILVFARRLVLEYNFQIRCKCRFLKMSRLSNVIANNVTNVLVIVIITLIIIIFMIIIYVWYC
jgi:hypothetical protein